MGAVTFCTLLLLKNKQEKSGGRERLASRGVAALKKSSFARGAGGYSGRMKMWIFRLWMLALACGLMAADAFAQAPIRDYSKSEFIIVSGGPALRKWEDLRRPQEQHDRWWGNFVRAARIRIQQIRRAHGDAARITWLVYRPAYEQRVPEDAARNADQPAAMSKIESVRDAYNLKMVYFNTGGDLIRHINSRPRGSIVNFEYFGHSNRDCWMFDYSAEISGASVAFLHEKQLGQIRRSVFDKKAFCKSWGCHTGESMSKFWKRAVGIPLIGAEGKTDYSVIIDHKTLPTLSGRPARWTQ